MILRLLLIFSLSSIGSSFIPEIEFDRCNADTVCYIRKSCIDGASENDMVRYTTEELKTGTCDVVLQIKPYNDQLLHIMMQVNIPNTTISNDGVALKQEITQFRCANGRETTENPKFSLTPHGESQPSLPHLIFCSFLLKSTEYIPIIFRENEEMTTIVYTSDQEHILKLRFVKGEFWNDILTAKSCDPDIVKSSDNYNQSYSYEKVDNTRDPITCSTGRILQIVRGNGDVENPERLECKEVVKKWQFVRQNGSQTETVIIGKINGVQEKITVYCVAKKCSLCKPLEDVNCAGCTPVNFLNKIGQCATSTCDNGLWRISEEGDAPAEGEMRCDHKMGSQNQRESVWYFTPKGKSNPVEISKAACAIDAVCLHPNPDDSPTITRTTCPESLNCNPVQPEGDRSKKDLYCRNGYQLRFKYDEKITDATNLTCSAITGKYSDGSNNILPDGSQIYCELIPPAVPTTTEIVSVAAASSFPTGAVVGGAVFVILIAIAGGFAFFYFSLRRKRKEIEDNEVAGKEDFVLRAKIANEAANPNPEKEVYRRIVPDSMKSRWELREYKSQGLEHLLITKDEWEDQMYCWDNSTFILVIGHKFMNANTEGRYKILRHLTAFDEYAVGERKQRQKDKKPPEQFGNLKQFMFLWNYANGKMFDCPCCWEYMFRFMRLLYDTFLPYDDHREICKVMLKAVVKVARPILNELTYRQRTWEDSGDTKLRPLVIRMLLWAEAPDVIAEMKRMADLPILDLQASIRPVVLQYAARNLGRAETMKTQYWGMIEGGTDYNKIDPIELIAGTLRQHLLFAICSARDETKKGTPDEYKTLREMMKIIFNYSKMDYTTTSYTPDDQWWAIRGATDCVAGFKPVLDLFLEFAPKNLDEIYEKHVDHTINFDLDKEKRKLVMREWRFNVKRLYNLLAELCTNKSRFNDLVTIVTPMVKFVKQDDEKFTHFYETELGERAHNFGNLFARKDVADVFFNALVQTEQGRNAQDHKEGDAYKNKQRRLKLNWSAHHSYRDRADDIDD